MNMFGEVYKNEDDRSVCDSVKGPRAKHLSVYESVKSEGCKWSLEHDQAYELVKTRSE